MRKHSVFVCVIICIVSCKEGKHENRSKSEKDNSKEYVSQKPNDTLKTTKCDFSIPAIQYTFRNDQFILNALNRELTRKYLDSNFHGVYRHTKTSANKYTPELTDTTVTYKADCDSIVYLASKASCVPLHITIYSQRITFENNTIKIGMLKGDFADIFKLKDKIPDAIKLTELEAANEFIFIFENNKISRIIYNNLYVE